MGSQDLSERSRRLLATLVREYIETGEPVSSQVLVRASGLGVSSATIRNVGNADAVNPRICDTIPKGLTVAGRIKHRKKVGRRTYCWTTSRIAAGTAAHDGRVGAARRRWTRNYGRWREPGIGK
mgnify:CR=1 FL=1